MKVQRWRSRRDSYRPAGEPIDTRHFEVAPIDLDRIAKAFVVEHHYAGTMPAARFRYGLWRGAELVGVAVFSVAQNPATYDGLPGSSSESVDLGRFVLLDDVPANGETWFLGRAFQLLRAEGIVTVVSFSDPVPRHDADGGLVMPGHVGTIYQAHNAVYLGRSKAERKWMAPDGRVLPGRALTKIRHRRRGWRYAAAVIEGLGADPLTDGEDASAWVARWIPRLCSPLRHPGNHKYTWALPRGARRHLPPSLPYPKMVA
ncbi:MAG: hypothetical protein K0U16_07180 [Gammaproteobacteria bacterium]|nr:hypothetical protein [Gammaproteobacteria bacterium]